MAGSHRARRHPPANRVIVALRDLARAAVRRVLRRSRATPPEATRAVHEQRRAPRAGPDATASAGRPEAGPPRRSRHRARSACRIAQHETHPQQVEHVARGGAASDASSTSPTDSRPSPGWPSCAGRRAAPAGCSPAPSAPAWSTPSRDAERRSSSTRTRPGRRRGSLPHLVRERGVSGERHARPGDRGRRHRQGYNQHLRRERRREHGAAGAARAPRRARAAATRTRRRRVRAAIPGPKPAEGGLRPTSTASASHTTATNCPEPRRSAVTTARPAAATPAFHQSSRRAAPRSPVGCGTAPPGEQRERRHQPEAAVDVAQDRQQRRQQHDPRRHARIARALDRTAANGFATRPRAAHPPPPSSGTQSAGHRRASASDRGTLVR